MAIQSEPQYAPVAASATDNTLVAAVAGKKIRVIALVLVASGGANNARFESGTAGTALTGVMNIGANGQLILPANRAGWFETAAATLLNLELSAATAVGGMLTYVTVE
jgi:hypothetical protein